VIVSFEHGSNEQDATIYGKRLGQHTAFISPLVPLRIASNVLLLLLPLLLLLAALIEHLLEELELRKGDTRQRADQGQEEKTHSVLCVAVDVRQ
jgi:hypothetical protein